MRYNKIRKMDISNGPGVRVSIFMQGCEFRCKNCFNAETWNFKGGKEFTDETLDKILNLCDNENVEGLSILGGEPCHPKNIEGTTRLAKAFKAKFPKKDLWIWSGFSFDKDLKDKELMNYADVAILSSHWEGFGLAIIEGMAAGKPAIACDIEGVREIVNGYGLLFKQGDEKDLAKHIKSLLGDSQFYQEIAAKCKSRAKHFDINVMVEKFIHLYKEVLND